jgi:hypothetical protein
MGNFEVSVIKPSASAARNYQRLGWLTLRQPSGKKLYTNLESLPALDGRSVSTLSMDFAVR